MYVYVEHERGDIDYCWREYPQVSHDMAYPLPIWVFPLQFTSQAESFAPGDKQIRKMLKEAAEHQKAVPQPVVLWEWRWYIYIYVWIDGHPGAGWIWNVQKKHH